MGGYSSTERFLSGKRRQLVQCTISRIVYYTFRAIVRRMIRFRLDKLLKKRDWTAYRLAKESGIHPSVLSKYVNSQVKEVSLETLDAMCRTLACKAGDVIEYVDEMKPPHLKDRRASGPKGGGRRTRG